MKKRRVIAILASLALTVGVGAVSFAGCSSLDYFMNGNIPSGPFAPNPNETFESKVSEGEYSSVDEAAAAFIEKEVSGSEHQYAMTDYTKQKELSTSEISQLNLEAQVDGEIESVEKGKVKYSEVSAIARAAQPLAASSANEVEIAVYIIKFTPQGKEVSSFKYVVALPENGEPIPYSYLCDVMDPAKYLNCTVASTLSSENIMTEAGYTMNSSINVSYSFLITEKNAKLDMSMQTVLENGQPITQTIAAYLAEVNGSLKVAAEYNGVYVATEVGTLGLGISKISDLFSSQIDQSQCSMYVKTSNGFKLADKFLDDAVKNMFDYIDVLPEGVQPTVNTKNEYKVVDGRLSRADVEMLLEISYDTNYMKSNYDLEVTYSNFGTTTVTLPDDVKTLLGVQ